MERQCLPLAFFAILVLALGCEYRKHDTTTATLKGDDPPAQIPRRSRKPIGNAILIDGTNVLPIYSVSAISATARAVGFTPINGGVRAVNEKGQTLWENKDVGAGGILGGFDFDGDGWPDIAMTKAEALSERCGDHAMVNSWLELLQGKDGTLHKPVSKEVSICWRYPSTT